MSRIQLTGKANGSGSTGATSARWTMSEPRYFRAKPKIVEAMRYDGTNIEALSDWCHRLLVDNTGTLLVMTLEGNMEASVGDWIIKGVLGEFYPCKPEAFELTYEEE